MSLTASENERVRLLARKIRDERFDGSATHLAAAVGVSQSLMSRFLSGRTGTSGEVAIRLASLAGIDPSTLLSGKAIRQHALPDNDPITAHEGGFVVESTPAPPTSDVHVSRAAAREMVKSAFDKETHEYEDAIAAEDALLAGAPFVRDLDPTEYVRRLLDTAARYRRKGQTVEGKDLHSATMKAAFEESRELRAQLARQREFEERARIFLRENGIDPDTLEPAKNTTHAPRLAAARPTTPRPKSGSSNK